ncbi:hypothetical protein GJ744_000428 [Endocarpon pusillum]|uniref:Glycine zipper 2TM domain-containing protein n=1 Tax=Endocarpon pusillum TaxID=364733 RepID=A0A8H7ADH3_9EURO|nr:hypothetical protein GJ744_000428 [Endocarpon pusillum]
MAAAEYYHQMPVGNGHQPNPVPISRPQYLSPQPTNVYPQTPPMSSPVPQQPHAPPPYQLVEMPAEKPYLPTDQQYQRNSFSHPERPPISPWNTSYNQPIPPGHDRDYYQKYPPAPQQYSQQPPQPLYHIPPPHLRLYHANASSPNLAQGYHSDPEPHRRRRTRRKSASRSTTADGFLGAAGGGLIGDMIFPGLGTLGGAVAGYFGGKDYGKHRKRRESLHRETQTQWEARHGKRGHSGERRHS